MLSPSRAVALALLTVVAGCGGTEGPAAAIAPKAVAPTPTPTPTPTASAVSVADVVVKIDDFEYRPHTLRISKGTRVAWKNVDAANHTVTFARGPGDLGNIREHGTRSALFTRAGTFSYVCEYHPSMHGKVIVT